MSDSAASEILVQGASALAHAEPEPGLEALLRVVAEELGIESAVIVVPSGPSGHLAIVAAHGLGVPAEAGLTAALRNPDHPVARTLRDPVASFDVPPSQPGGPALRSHLPVTVTRAGTVQVLGVLALAHHAPMGAGSRRSLGAVADLAALALERSRPA